ncbi:MAG: hypothetical protein GY924_19575 [Planctomycetaceae bacterium]|nr:hypothetical protein [Planctomycetaceae bacterium]
MNYQHKQFQHGTISPATSAEIERLLYHMPAVAQGNDEWVSGFALSILRQCRRRGWQPSERQLNMMRRLVSDLFIYSDNSRKEGDLQVIED